jgi:hypothetical protein
MRFYERTLGAKLEMLSALQTFSFYVSPVRTPPNTPNQSLFGTPRPSSHFSAQEPNLLRSPC